MKYTFIALGYGNLIFQTAEPKLVFLRFQCFAHDSFAPHYIYNCGNCKAEQYKETYQHRGYRARYQPFYNRAVHYIEEQPTVNACGYKGNIPLYVPKCKIKAFFSARVHGFLNISKVCILNFRFLVQ